MLKMAERKKLNTAGRKRGFLPEEKEDFFF